MKRGSERAVSKPSVSNRPPWPRWLFAALLLGVCPTLAPSCQCNPTLFDPPGLGGLRLYLQLDHATEVNITGVELQVQRMDVVTTDLETGIERVTTILEGPLSLSRAATAEGIPLLVVAELVPVGRLEQVRFIVSRAKVRTVVTEEQAVLSNVDDARVPSGSQTGVKIVLRDEVIIEVGEEEPVVGLFDASKNIVRNRGQGMLIKPTIEGRRLERPTIHDALGPDDALLIVAAREFPATGVRLERAKVLNLTTNRIRDVVLDGADGQAVSFEQVRQDHEAVWRDNFGALHFALFRRLSQMDPDAVVDAEVWAAPPAFAPFLSDASEPELWVAEHKVYVAERRAAAAPAVDALRSALLDANIQVISSENDPPTVSIRATRAELEQVVAFLPQAEFVVGIVPAQLLANRAARDLVEEPLFFAHILGRGRNLRIAVQELNACIAPHRDFDFVTFDDTVGSNGRCAAGTAHATRVAGVLASFRVEEGLLGLAGLFAGTLFEAQLLSDSLLAASPHFVNRSETITPDNRRRIDHFVYGHRIFVANGACQSGICPPTEPATCYAYNSVCVGGYEHHDTLGPGRFDDDTQSDSLSLNDPLTGREEPDVVAPYTVNAPSDAGFRTTDSGTSYSTPAVTGLAALLTANFPAELLGEPTLLRAVLLASADHNIVQDNEIPRCTIEPCAPSAHVALFADGLDDRDGAGAPRGDLARNILDNERFVSGFVTRPFDFDVNGDFPPITFSVEAFDVVRVALVWDQCADSMVSLPDALLVDLDMVVTGPPTGPTPDIVKTNPSIVDNYEALHFIAIEAGEYRIQIQAQRWEACPGDPFLEANGISNLRTHMAVAWSVDPLVP